MKACSRHKPAHLSLISAWSEGSTTRCWEKMGIGYPPTNKGYIRRPLPTAGGARQRRGGKSEGDMAAQDVRGPQAGRQLRQLFRPGERAVCEFWRLKDRGRGPQAGSVPQGPAVLVRRRRRLWGLAAGRQLRQRVFLQVQKSNVRHWGPLPAGPVRPQGPAVSLWRGRRLWALLAAGRQLVFL